MSGEYGETMEKDETVYEPLRNGHGHMGHCESQWTELLAITYYNTLHYLLNAGTQHHGPQGVYALHLHHPLLLRVEYYYWLRIALNTYVVHRLAPLV